MRGEGFDVTRAVTERRRVEREHQRSAGSDAADEILEGVAGQEPAAKVPRPRDEEIGVRPVPTSGHAMTALTVLALERGAVEGERSIRRRENESHHEAETYDHGPEQAHAER